MTKVVFYFSNKSDDHRAQPEWDQTGLETPGGLSADVVCGGQGRLSPPPCERPPRGRCLSCVRARDTMMRAALLCGCFLHLCLFVRAPPVHERSPTRQPQVSPTEQPPRRDPGQSRGLTTGCWVFVLEGEIIIIKHVCEQFGGYFSSVFITLLSLLFTLKSI